MSNYRDTLAAQCLPLVFDAVMQGKVGVDPNQRVADSIAQQAYDMADAMIRTGSNYPYVHNPEDNTVDEEGDEV